MLQHYLRWLRLFKSVLAVGLLALSLFLYQNCGVPLHTNVTESFSLLSGSCESNLMNAFGTTYYSAFKAKCSQCHQNGPGVGAFANKDFPTAFNGFMSLGRARVERNFLNPGHQPEITGDMNQPLVDRSQNVWTQAEAEFQKCSKDGGSTTVLPGSEIVTLGKINSTILQNATRSNSWVKLDYDLENEMTSPSNKGKFLLSFSIEVRVAMMNGQMRGYEFRNPTVRLKPTATTPFRLNKILISINQVILYDVTTYEDLSSLVVSMSDFNLAPNASLALAVRSSVKATDSFAIAFGSITQEMGPIGGDPGGGTTGGGSTGGPTGPTLPASITHAELLSTNSNINVFRRICMNCHNSSNMNGGLDVTNYDSAKSKITIMLQRINDNTNPMPPTGLLNQFDRDLIDLWQKSGTP